MSALTICWRRTYKNRRFFVSSVFTSFALVRLELVSLVGLFCLLFVRLFL